MLEPADCLPFSGRDGSERIYVHSGDSGTGMTNGVAGALNFVALYRNEKARFAELFDPARKPVSGYALDEYVKGQGPVVADLGRIFAGGEVVASTRSRPAKAHRAPRGLPSTWSIAPTTGRCVERSAVCTHVGCIVHWTVSRNAGTARATGRNSSRNGNGSSNGPAIRPLRL